MAKKNKQKTNRPDEEAKFPLPIYDKEDDIYNREKEEALKDEDATEIRSDNNAGNPEDDLDIPGAELDNKDEVIGEEDEENNYYSLGGDRHDDLEEDKE